MPAKERARRVVTLTPNPTLDAISEIPQGCLPRKDEVLRVNFRYRIGGKGITCSRTLKMLGGESLAVVLLGDDSISSCIDDYLRREEIETEILRTSGQGRICLILTEIDETANLSPGVQRALGDYRINGSGLKVNEKVVAELGKTLARSLDGSGALALAGSLPEGAPPDFYAQCIEEARAKVPLVMLDSSGRALLNGVKGRPHLVKINGKEAAGLMNADEPREIWEALDLAREIAAVHRIDRVVITLGSAGAVAVEGTSNWVLRAPKIVALGGLGAGDSFFAGLAYGLTNGSSFPEALRWGGACGAATAERPAGLVGTIDRVKALYEKVEVLGMTSGPALREASAASEEA